MDKQMHQSFFQMRLISIFMMWFCCCSANLAFSQGTQELTVGQARQHLTWAHQELVRAHQLLPSEYGTDPDKELQQIQAAEAIVHSVVGSLRGAHKVDEKGFATTQTNIARLKTQLKLARLAQRVSVTKKSIRVQHANGAPAGTALLRSYEDQVAALAAQGGQAWQPTVVNFQEKGVGFRQKDVELAAALEDQKKIEAVEEAQRVLDQAISEANETIKAIETHLSGAAQPIPESLLDDLWQASKQIQKLSDPASRYYFHAEYNYRMFNGWLNPDNDASFRQISSGLRGANIDSGEVKKSKFKVTFKSRPQWCYILYVQSDALRYETKTALERNQHYNPYQSLSLTPKPLNHVIQRFDIASYPILALHAWGFCTTDTTKIRLSAKVRPELSGDARFLMLGWNKRDFPEWDASYLQTSPGQPCDLDGWSARWTKPIPHTLVYVDKEPHLLLNPGSPGQSSIRVQDLNGEVKDITKDRLATAVPSSLAFPDMVAPTGCPLHFRSSNDHYSSYAKCGKKRLQKVDRSTKKILRRLKKASSLKDQEDEYTLLEDARAAHQDTISARCSSVEDRLFGAVRQNFGRIADHLEDTSSSVPMKRAKTLSEESSFDGTK